MLSRTSPLAETDATGKHAKLPLIRKLAQYAPLGVEQQQALARSLATRVQTVGRGIPLIEAGDPATEIFIMLDGWACSTRPAIEGRAPIVALHLPGDVCDFGAMVKRQADCTVTALNRLKVAVLSRAAVATLTRDHPLCGQAFWWEFVSASAVRGQWVARLSHGSARGRLASLLCELAVRLYAVGLADDTGFDLPITQVDLGHSCGFTPEHTNRVLRDLRARNIVSWEKGRLVLHDWDALSAEARFDPAYLHFRGIDNPEQRPSRASTARDLKPFQQPADPHPLPELGESHRSVPGGE